MKVLYLNPMGQLGGAERSLLNLLQGFQEIGCDLDPSVLATADGPFLEAVAGLGVQARVLPFPKSFDQVGDGAHHFGGRELLRAAGMLQDIAWYRTEMRRAIRKLNPDVIHTNGFKMHLLGAWSVPGRQTGRVLVGHIHDYVGSRPAAGRMLRFSAGRFDRFIANSESVASDVRRTLGATPVDTVYNAVDASFTREGAACDLDQLAQLPMADPGVVRVGLLATFARWKGHLTFLRALAQVPRKVPLRAYIVGAPIYRREQSQFSKHELEREVERLGLGGRVGFTGFVTKPAEAIRALDLIVHASTAPEPFGMTIIEAMACGKAVIASRLGGATELFEEGISALAHSAGDERDLAEKITMLAGDPELRRRIGGKAAATVASRFGNTAMAKRVYTLYQACLTGNTEPLPPVNGPSCMRADADAKDMVTV